MNSRSSSTGRMYENEFSEFLMKRIANAGGSVQLHHLPGHISQVRSEVRNAIGGSKEDLIQFLKRHNNLFVIKDNVVSLVNSSTSGYDSDSSSNKSHSNLPPRIKNGKGVVIKIFTGYGFIKSKEPIKTEIFFTSSCFGDRDIDLTSFLHVGAIVFFHAVKESSRESKSRSCNYKAWKVWRIDNGDEGSAVIQKSRKTRETGLYDPINLESEGLIQKVFPNLGFISVKGDDNNTVFFHKNRVVNYDNIVDLTKVFSEGDKVEFAAHRSSKPDAKARWEATKVWKKSGKTEQDIDAHIWDGLAQDTSSQISLPKQSVSGLRTKSHEMIKNQSGKIYPRSHGAVIKFGNNQMADGDSALYYVCGTQVFEIGWEFTEGHDIYFDAVKIKSAPGWKAVLVWTDTKPDVVLPTCLGDFSAFTEEDNEEICSSIYTSRSSLCKSESSNSIKSDKISSNKAEDLKKERIKKLSGNFVGEEFKDNSKRLSKTYKSTSRDSLNSQPVSDKYCFVSNENGSSTKKLSKNRRNSSKDSLNSLPVSDKYSFVGKENTNIDKKLSKNQRTFSRDSLSSLPVSEKHHHLKSTERVVKSSSNKSVSQLSKAFSDWGDSPYPADEAYESMEVSRSIQSDFSLKCGSEGKGFTEDEMENSSEYASAEEERLDSNAELESDKALSQDISSKCEASIRRHHDIEGKIKKVFSKFAEITSCNIKKAATFSLNDFCLNGRFVDELGVDDLKQKLKIGDRVKFNYFVIIDDSGQTWQKVTLAWKGLKPRYSEEVTPEYFIEQNDLSVTVSNETNNDKMADKVISRKFLTSFVDETPDNDDNLSKTESCSEEDSLTLSLKSEVHSKTELPVPLENLSDTVYNILKRGVFSNNSMVDIKPVSEEIINIILRNCTKKANTLAYNVLPETSCVAKSLEYVCSVCKEKSLNSSNGSIKMKNTAVQTVITGDIISTNILPEC